MRQCGGFYIEPKNENDSAVLLNAVREFLVGLEMQTDNFWLEALNDDLFVDYETFIDYSEYDSNDGSLFIRLCKYVAQKNPTINFNGVSHYCNENTGFNMDYIVKHHGHNSLRIYELEYFDGDETECRCPDCETPLLVELWDGDLKPIIPNEVFCPNCEKTLRLKDVAKMTTIKI